MSIVDLRRLWRLRDERYALARKPEHIVSDRSWAAVRVYRLAEAQMLVADERKEAMADLAQWSPPRQEVY